MLNSEHFLYLIFLRYFSFFPFIDFRLGFVISLSLKKVSLWKIDTCSNLKEFLAFKKLIDDLILNMDLDVDVDRESAVQKSLITYIHKHCSIIIYKHTNYSNHIKIYEYTYFPYFPSTQTNFPADHFKAATANPTLPLNKRVNIFSKALTSS